MREYRDGERAALRPALRGRAGGEGPAEELQPLGPQVPPGQPQEDRNPSSQSEGSGIFFPLSFNVPDPLPTFWYRTDPDPLFRTFN